MRTYYILLKLLVVVLILNGCSQSEDSDTTIDQQEDIEANPMAVIGELEALSTRTSLDITHNVVWSSGDEIHIFGASNISGETYITTSNNTRTGIFLPVDMQKTVDDATRYAIYPAAAASKAQLVNSTLEIDLEGLTSQAYAQTLATTTDISNLPMIAVSNEKSFAFKNICGGIQLQINDYQSLGLKIKTVVVKAKGKEQITGTVSVDAATGTPTLKKAEGKNAITIDCGDGINISSGGSLAKSSGIVIFMPAGVYEDGFSFLLTDTDGRNYEIETKQAMTITAGVVSPLHSLPLTLYYGEANSYRVSGAETITINTTPYYTFSENFVHESLVCSDSAGKIIGLATKAKIVWQQVNSKASGDVVSNIQLDNTTLKVTTTGKLGNAVVAICDANDVIIWSYHIWVTDANDLAYTNTARGSFKLMDRNLGATSTTIKDRNAYGLFYQWGRKDPFARNLVAERPAAANQYENTPSDLQKSESATAETGTIAYATRNPQVRLLSASDWYAGTGGNDNLWGYVDQNNGVKSVYDPCPAGYRVADYSCFAELPVDDKVNCNDQYGYLMKVNDATTSYYATGGYLPQNKDVMQYLEYRGYLWNNHPSTGPNSATSATPNRFMYNNAGFTIDKSEYRSAGMSVRCLKIE